MPSNRTDIHRPTTLVTEDYEYVQCYDNDATMGGCPVTGDPRMLAMWRQAMDAAREQRARLNALVATSSVDRGLSQCHHCGAHLRYGAVMHHIPTDTHIAVGETCLENRFERASADFHTLRRQAQLDRAAQRIVTARAAFVAENPDLAWMDGDVDGFPEEVRTNPFVQDVARKLHRYGELSERQIAAVRRSVDRAIEQAIARDREPEPVPAPEGRIEVTGEVLSTKWVENDFGGTIKMLVKVPADGSFWKLWTTVPSALECERGDTVHIKVTVTPSNDDPAFALGRRPTVVR